MKKILFLFAVITALHSNSQTQFDYLGGLPINSNATGCFYFDLNTGNTGLGFNDVFLAHGDGEIYFGAVYPDSMRAPGKNVKLSSIKLWSDCAPTNGYSESRVYVIKGDKKLSNGNHVLPFKWGDLYNFFVILIEDSIIYVRGWVFNIPASEFECYTL